MNESERFRFLVGLMSFNLKSQVPSDVHTHNQIIDPSNHQSQIGDCTKNQKIMIDCKKTKTMIFNFTEKYQFGIKLEIGGTPIEMIDIALSFWVPLS